MQLRSHNSGRTNTADRMSVRLIVFGLLIALPSISTAQTNIEYWSDTPIDARSISLGEAFVAVAQGPSALFYNVAGMASQKGLAVEFDTRTEPVVATKSEVQHFDFAGTLGTVGKGTIGLRYSEYYEGHGPLALHDSAGNTTGHHELSMSVSDIMFAYSIHLTPTLDLGVGGGVVLQGTDFIPFHPSYLLQWDSRETTSGYFDVGIHYHESILKSRTPDEFNFAASLNHLGFSYSKSYNDGTVLDLARTFRGGLAWKIAQPETSWIANQLFSAMLTGQFKKVFNEGDFSSDQFRSNKGYWSMGMEIGLWDMFFIRYGLYYRPYDSQYSYANNAQANFGGGVKIPVHKIFGAATPLWLTVDYAMMHLLNDSYEHAFSATMHLDHDFFPAPPAPVDQ